MSNAASVYEPMVKGVGVDWGRHGGWGGGLILKDYIRKQSRGRLKKEKKHLAVQI